MDGQWASNGSPSGNDNPRLESYEEFDHRIEGKTAHEVILLIGRPDSALHMPDADEVWYYRNRTVNPVTRKPDSPRVIFSDGRVNRVDHS
jgi:hypothetical protein